MTAAPTGPEPRTDAAVDMPQDWIDAFEERFGIPAWAALQAWDEAADDDTAAHIRRRAQDIAGDAEPGTDTAAEG